MTVDAEELAVADDALPRVRSGLLIVHRDEVRPVHRIAHGSIEAKSRWNSRHSDPVTGRALPLRVAGRAEVPLCIRLHAVLAQKVPIVNHVAFRERHFPRQIDVASPAVARCPLSLVGVTAEAGWVLGAHVVGVDRDVDVASHAVACALFGVCGM